MEVFSETWLNNLKDTVSENFMADLLLRLFIFWVFDKPSEFRNTSKIIQLESTARIEEDPLFELPLPKSIIGMRSLILSQHLCRADGNLDEIERRRQEAISQAISIIHHIIAEYQESKVHCPRIDDKGFECDAMTLGALIKSSKQIGIWPMPEPPYNGRSFSDLVCIIRQMKLPVFCVEMTSNYKSCKKSKNRKLVYGHNEFDDIGHAEVKSTIEASMKSLEDGLHGLDLESFETSR